MADEYEIGFERIGEDYPLPEGFDSGVGRVRDLNESLPGYYASLAAMVNKIREHKARLEVQYKRWIYLEVERLLLELDEMWDGALERIDEIEELQGVAFEVPEVLDDALSDLLDDSDSDSDSESDED